MTISSYPEPRTKVRRSVAVSLPATVFLLAAGVLYAETIEVEMERSQDLQAWESVPITPEMLTEEGRIRLDATDDSAFLRLRITRDGDGDPLDDFSLIPSGTFEMGSPEVEPGRGSDEGPQHPVTLTRSFYLRKTSVTWAQWNEVRDWAVENGYVDLSEGQMGSHGDLRNTDDDPVTHVSWYDVVKWLNAKTEMENALYGRNLTPAYTVEGSTYRTREFGSTGSGIIDWDPNASGYRLPTEAEWEYAVRAGTETAFYNGPITSTGWEEIDPNLHEIAWYRANSNQTHPVGGKQPNGFGLYDMSGNVWDWCWDFHGEYGDGAVTDPTGPESGESRVMRGGSWNNRAGLCRSATRLAIRGADWTGPAVGFRLARNSAP